MRAILRCGCPACCVPFLVAALASCSPPESYITEVLPSEPSSTDEQKPERRKTVPDGLEDLNREFVSEDAVTDPAEKESCARLKDEALQNFNETARLFVKKDYGHVLFRVLDDGEPLPLDEIADMYDATAPARKEYEEAVDRTAGLLSLIPRTASPGMAQFGTRPNRDDVIVAIEFADSTPPREGLDEWAAAWLRAPSPTHTDAGDLVVVMRRIDGRWYWNPFGW